MDRKQGLGTSAGVVAILALVLRLAVPTATKTPGQSSGAASDSKPAVVGGGSAASGRPETAQQLEIEGPWLATQTFFHNDPSGVECPTDSGKGDSIAVVGCANTPDFTHLSVLKTCAANSRCRDALSRYFGLINDSGHRARLQYVIATVPDPLHSRLALSTDSTIETIEKAAFDSHWEFAAQWLPWYDSSIWVRRIRKNAGNREPW